jgi:hypothetical protein
MRRHREALHLIAVRFFLSAQCTASGLTAALAAAVRSAAALLA